VAHGERDPEHRLTRRNGYRERRWDTRVGTVELAIPRVRDGSYFPSLLEPRRRAERALLAVVQEAYVLGVSTRRVEDLVEALGIASISKSEVSRICAALDAEVEAFRSRALTGERYPYLWLDATYVKVREGGRVVSMGTLVATGVAATGERRVLGLELAAGNDDGSAWPAFIRSLVERGLAGVRLVISDDHRGLVKAVRESSWARPGNAAGCTSLERPGPRAPIPRSTVTSAIRSVFEQPDQGSAREQSGRLIASIRPGFPAVADLLTDAEADLLAHFSFPDTHRRPYFRPETMAAIDAVIDPEEESPVLLMAS
jgi:putative transposase